MRRHFLPLKRIGKAPQYFPGPAKPPAASEKNSVRGDQLYARILVQGAGSFFTKFACSFDMLYNIIIYLKIKI